MLELDPKRQSVALDRFNYLISRAEQAERDALQSRTEAAALAARWQLPASVTNSTHEAKKT